MSRIFIPFIFDAFTDQAVFTHPGRGVDGYTEAKMNPSGGYMDMQWFSWTQLYPFIRSANIAILKLTANEGGLDAGLTKRLLGEAYFMRGYFFTQLMRQYGGIVLLTEPLTLESEAENPRSSFEATVNQIISDLDQAISLLADAPVDKARAHKITALALKSRVLTHAASDLYEPSKPSGKALINFEKMLNECNEFMTTVIRFAGLFGYDRNPGRFLAGRKEVRNGEAPVNLIHRDDCINIIELVIEKNIAINENLAL